MRAVFPLAIVAVAVIATAFLLMRRPFARQMEEARLLERSVAELQKKVYTDGPAESGFADLIELTSSGLSD